MESSTSWASHLAQRWHQSNTVRADEVPTTADLVDVKRAAGSSVAVVIPAVDEAATIGAICAVVASDLLGSLVDDLVVLDGGSVDGTARAAAAAGARVVAVDGLLPDVPPIPGKGDAMWRGLTAVDGDILVYLDGDIRNFTRSFVERTVGPLLMRPELVFVKGYYRRPILEGEAMVASGGGRVTELTARPLLDAFFPELTGFIQPLAGEYAARRTALMQIPFFTGYSVEVGLLIDLLEHAGIDAMAQVDLDERVHRNRPLAELGPMAHAIARTILRRAEGWGRMRAAHDYVSAPMTMPDGDGLTTAGLADVERPPAALFEAAQRSVAAEG